jgi:tRNA A-37 threonylcarbamoyl transferase component Bud32
VTTAAETGAIVGAWELLERIGGGGQASVHRARHATLGRPAAVKLFRRSVWADHAFRVRFRRECDALLALRHPHVVPIHDAGEQDGRGYLVMALARGGSLAGRIAQGSLAPAEAIATLAPIASALDAAHAAGLVHRDVTPANVLLDPDGPWLADFGIARRLDATATTGEGVLVGTAGFLAPEVIAGGPAEPASDRYALAAVAFEALVGRPPFAADGAPGMLYAHLHRAVPRASSLRPDLAPAVDAALRRGLAKDPRDRPASARELVDSLARATARPGRRGRRGRRLAAPAALLAAGALAAGAAVAVTAALAPGDPPRGGALSTVVTEPPLVVPAPAGRVVPARPARAADLPGVEGAAGAAAADVGDVRVVSVPGGARELAAAAAALADRGLRVDPLVVGGREVGLLAFTPVDLIGTEPRWALLAVTGRGRPTVVLVRGPRDAPGRYAAAL